MQNTDVPGQSLSSRKPRRRRVLGAFLLALTALVVWTTILLAALPRRTLGSHTLSLLDGAQRVETFRLKSDPQDEERSQIRDFPLRYVGPTQGREFAARVAAVLHAARTFWGPNDVTCLPDPGVAFRLWRGRECVEVLLCFHCNQMLVATKDAQGKVVHTAYTEFGSMRGELVTPAKQAFPRDAEIQALR